MGIGLKFRFARNSALFLDVRDYRLLDRLPELNLQLLTLGAYISNVRKNAPLPLESLTGTYIREK